jgi:uncharacterized repeat protein (TIGR03803 family)
MTFVVVLASAVFAPAQTLSTVYSFTGGPDGAYPIPGVIQDTGGNLYGTTLEHGPDGFGTVFEINTSGILTVLHAFTGGTDGAYPYAPLLRDSEGNLYGNTTEGGASGDGVVFKIDTAGNFTTLHAFVGGTTDGCNPYQGLVMDKPGNLYGTTNGCGASNDGTVFKLTSAGKETILHSFTGGTNDGGEPSFYGHLLLRGSGLYGLTQLGGAYGDGVLYELNAEGLKVLYSFAGGTSDGCYSTGTPAMDAGGNFYGVTYGCGSHNYGTVWGVSEQGKETILHNFAGGDSDGCNPISGVVLGAPGTLYGTTTLCGAYNDQGNGYGTMWEMSQGTLTLLHSFNGLDGDGAIPYGELLRGSKAGYGTTLQGGSHGYGTVWSYAP